MMVVFVIYVEKDQWISKAGDDLQPDLGISR
jgi:hypothetical protein